MIRALKQQVKNIVSPKMTYLRRFGVMPGDVVIDLGANVGEVAEYFLGKGARVYAYEPNPYAFAILEKRTGRRKGATLFPAAVSDRGGKSRLWLHRDHNESEVKFSQASSLQAEKSNVSEDYVEVDVIAIADVLDAHAHIRLIKIDIEGGEYDIMDTVLANMHKIDYVLLETHEKKNAAFREKNDRLLEAIAHSGHKDKIFMDWF